MKRYIYMILLGILATSCTSVSSDETNEKLSSTKVDNTMRLLATDSTDTSFVEDATEYENATYFVVVADTSQNYYVLHKKMNALHKQLRIPIDTMGRYYNQAKNLISLPDDDEDEIYAGGYYPRRFPSENLSLEYLNFYRPTASENMIALIVGIYETEKSADSALVILQKSAKESFKVTADIYVGCMH